MDDFIEESLARNPDNALFKSSLFAAIIAGPTPRTWKSAFEPIENPQMNVRCDAKGNVVSFDVVAGPKRPHQRDFVIDLFDTPHLPALMAEARKKYLAWEEKYGHEATDDDPNAQSV